MIHLLLHYLQICWHDNVNKICLTNEKDISNNISSAEDGQNSLKHAALKIKTGK